MIATVYTVVCAACDDCERYGLHLPPGRVEATGAAKALRARCRRQGVATCRLAILPLNTELDALDLRRLGLAPEPPPRVPPPGSQEEAQA